MAFIIILKLYIRHLLFNLLSGSTATLVILADALKASCCCLQNATTVEACYLGVIEEPLMVEAAAIS